MSKGVGFFTKQKKGAYDESSSNKDIESRDSFKTDTD